MLKIANVIRDQHFIDGQIAYHDLTADVCNHDYYIISWDKNLTFKYMTKVDRVRIVTPDEFVRIMYSESYDALFIHNFLYMPLHYMNRLPKDLRVFWFAWGYDIYCTPRESPYINIPLYHPKSLAMLKQIRANAKSQQRMMTKLKLLLKRILCSNRVDHNDEVNVYRKAVGRVDYFAGVFPLEYDLLKVYPEFRAKQVLYEYTNPKDFAPFPEVLPKIGKNILVGNSADINNNHLDILDYLKLLHIDNKIIVPLSYGGSRYYVDYVSKAFKQELGDKCLILKDYMPREDYYRLLSTCGSAVFFHERQQATCNIEELLKHGVKVFLSETSINYRHYKSIGIHIYSVQSELNEAEVSTPLTDEQKWTNIRILYQTSNIEYRLQYLYNIYSILQK